MACKPAKQNQSLLPIRFTRDDKIVSSTNYLLGQIGKSSYAIEEHQLWSATRQRAGTVALSTIHADFTFALNTTANYADDATILAAHKI